ncbi:hypothetical protein ACVWXM_009676 [Bradyrhizobium sp. GM7.3]
MINHMAPAWRELTQGETIRSIAAALQVSSSCVTKWKNLRPDTASCHVARLAARRSELPGCHRRLAAQTCIRSAPFTLVKLTQELAARGSRQTCGRCGLLFTARARLKKPLLPADQDRPDGARKRTCWKAHQGRIASRGCCYRADVDQNQSGAAAPLGTCGLRLRASAPFGNWKTMTHRGAAQQYFTCSVRSGVEARVGSAAQLSTSIVSRPRTEYPLGHPRP